MPKYKTPSTVWTRYKHDPNIYNWLCLKLHIYKYRLIYIFLDPSLWRVVNLYRRLEPKWLAKITCASYAFQCRIDAAVDNYLKKTNVKVYKKTFSDPGYITHATFIVKKGGWKSRPTYRGRYKDEQTEWKYGLKKAVSKIWCDGEYAGNWSQDAVNYKGKWCNKNWQWHFMQSFKSDFFGDHHEFLDSNDEYKVWRHDD